MGSHVCAHVIAAKLVSLACLSDGDICLQPFLLTVTCQSLATEERGGGGGMG